MEAVQKLLGDNPTIWVFGYGSLLWKPDFRFKSKKIGYIKDYERRFYQGNVTFRGKPGQPGRVANLVENKGNQAWGVAYEISGREEVTQVLQALYSRETTSGGYITIVTTFYPRDEQSHKPVNRIRSSVSSDEFTKSDSNAYSGHSNDLSSEYHPSLTRVDSNISDLSIDDTSSDEDFSDSPDERVQHAMTVTDCEFDIVKHLHKGMMDSSFIDENTKVDCLKLDQHLYSSDNKTPTNLPTDIELLEHSNHESLSFSHDLSKPSRLNEEVTEERSKALQVLLYTATPDNDLYLGPDDLTSMARQIVFASGSAGSNVEYVTKTADYVRRYIPEDQDSHLFTLDAKVREEVYRQHAGDSTRLQLGLADLSYDLHDLEYDVISEAVMAS